MAVTSCKRHSIVRKICLLIVSELLIGDPAQSLGRLARLEQGTQLSSYKIISIHCCLNRLSWTLRFSLSTFNLFIFIKPNWTSLKVKWLHLLVMRLAPSLFRFKRLVRLITNSLYSTRLKTLKPKLRMELLMSCSIKGLRYLARSPRASGFPITTSRNSELFSI